MFKSSQRLDYIHFDLYLLNFKLGVVIDYHYIEDDDNNIMHSHALLTGAEHYLHMAKKAQALSTPAERLAKTHIYHKILIRVCHHISSIPAMASISSSNFASRSVCACPCPCFALTPVLTDSSISSSASNASKSSSGGW